MIKNNYCSANNSWLKLLNKLISFGQYYKSRNGDVRELPSAQIVVNMNYPLITIPTRKLNYRFMLAETLWMLKGQNDVETVAKYNKKMHTYSDDGITLSGAYGPEIMKQFSYVVNTLFLSDHTRQATLTIWKQNPEPSKDIPCTLAMTFIIRDNSLQAHVSMRSSDVWLGLPYDIFCFSMIARIICASLNKHRKYKAGAEKITPYELGNLYITAASSHLYEQYLEKAIKACNQEIAKQTEPWVVDENINYMTCIGDTHSILETIRSAIENPDSSSFWIFP